MISIREATPRDHPACAAIFEAAWNGAFPKAQRRIGVAELAAETRDELVIVALTETRLCGFASLYAPDAFLHHLYVAPDIQRRHVGSSLLREIQVRASAPLSLKCQAANAGARAFYAKHGFLKTGIGDDEYGPWISLARS